MSSCFGLRRKRIRLDEEEPLVPEYDDDTVLQRKLHQKLHSYQMVRALSQGFMPSNEQVLINLRTLLASSVLNPDTSDLTDSGRLLAKYAKRWVEVFIELLLHKNSRDQIQDFVWFLTQARMSVDVEDLQRKAMSTKAKADSVAAYQSIQTVGSLLLTNSDFRVLLSDIQTIGRDIFKDSAFAVSAAAEDAGKKLEQMPAAPDLNGGKVNGDSDKKSKADSKPTERRGADLLKESLDDGGPSGGQKVSQQDLENDTKAVAKIVGDEIAEVSKKTVESAQSHIDSDEPKVLLNRLTAAVSKLRQRPNYEDSVSTLSTLIKKYAITYSRAAEHVADTTADDFAANQALQQAVENFWSLVRSFGEPKEWDALEDRFRQLVEHQKRNPEFESLMTELSNAVQKLLTDPGVFQDTDVSLQQLRDKINDAKTESSLREDLEGALQQLTRTLATVAADEDLAKLWDTTLRLFTILSPTGAVANSDLFRDLVHVFAPLLIQAVQYLPIPRLEVSVPEIDLLLENLILEPGKTVNHSSFLPFRIRAEMYNDVEVRKTHTLSTVATASSFVTIKIDGLSVAADEVGFWLRAHSGFFGLADEGIASFFLDERGLDIAVDVELGQDRLEKLVSLKAVRVNIHHLDYTLRQSKFRWVAWLLKPLLRPILKRVLQRQLASSLADLFHAANRELLYARERLRATRIADPGDVATFFRAIFARLTPAPDPDVYTRVGVAPPKRGAAGYDSRAHKFAGVYAPGSIAKVWEEQARQATERIDDAGFNQQGWRNAIFDVSTAAGWT